MEGLRFLLLLTKGICLKNRELKKVDIVIVWGVEKSYAVNLAGLMLVDTGVRAL